MRATVRYSQNQDIRMPSERQLANQEFMNKKDMKKKNDFIETKQLLGPDKTALWKRS